MGILISGSTETSWAWASSGHQRNITQMCTWQSDDHSYAHVVITCGGSVMVPRPWITQPYLVARWELFCWKLNWKARHGHYLFCCCLVVIHYINSADWIVLKNNICTLAVKPCVLKCHRYSVFLFSWLILILLIQTLFWLPRYILIANSVDKWKKTVNFELGNEMWKMN